MTIIAPEKPLTNGIDYEVTINEEGTIVDALSEIDKMIYQNPEKNMIYEDCAVNAYGPNREFMPIMENADLKLYPDSNIILSVHADWWAEVMQERLDYGTFKRIIMKKYGKNHESFAHYFKFKTK